jgi:flagellar biosynthetic protein FliQ
MGEAEIGAAMRETMLVVLKLGAPALLAALAIGVLMSVVQAVTQINEVTLTFVPKVLVIGGMLALTGPFMLSSLTVFAQSLFDKIIEAGGQ